VSDPETVTKACPLKVFTVQGYIQIDVVDDAVIKTLETCPEILMVGVEDIASLKVAVIVTKLEADTKLSESVSVNVKVGAELSMVKVILSVPA
jgi:hypothetical protein